MIYLGVRMEVRDQRRKLNVHAVIPYAGGIAPRRDRA
jgi:hypothetical protein